MKILMIRKMEVEIGDCPPEVFKRAVADNDIEVINDVERIGFDSEGEIVVYSILSSETTVVEVAEVEPTT